MNTTQRVYIKRLLHALIFGIGLIIFLYLMVKIFVPFNEADFEDDFQAKPTPTEQAIQYNLQLDLKESLTINTPKTQGIIALSKVAFDPNFVWIQAGKRPRNNDIFTIRIGQSLHYSSQIIKTAVSNEGIILTGILCNGAKGNLTIIYLNQTLSIKIADWDNSVNYSLDYNQKLGAYVIKKIDLTLIPHLES